jgi:tetratricopeptide (TPR) repeat protein
MKRILSALALAVLFAAILSSAALADVAPPHHPPGSNPGPGNEITQVRMMAETVTIDVLADDPPQAHVSAFFTMRNLGSSAESMAVRFPIAASNGFDKFPEIKNVGIKVNDKPTPFDRIQGPEPLYGFENQDVPWASFPVTFTPGDDVQIKVSYDLDGTGYPQETYTSFFYILATGAGWNGTIGSADIILRLPYEANPQTVILGDSQAAPQFNGREAHWKLTDFEPTKSDNLTFDIVKPVVWKQVVIELENTAKNPQDGEAYGRLGKAYKQALFAAPKGFPRTDPGAGVLYQLSKDAYSKAVTLKPKDGLWHAGYADLVLGYYSWAPPYHSQDNQPYTAELDLGLKEFNLACQLAPTDPKVQELIVAYGSSFPNYVVQKSDGKLDFLALTQTPPIVQDNAIPTDTLAPTDTIVPPDIIVPTQTSAPAAQPATEVPIVPVAEPTPKPASPVCGGAALALLPLALVVWKSRKGRKG